MGPDRTIPASLGRYRIIKRLTCGGMAELFLGRAHGIAGFEKHAAVKRMLPNLAVDPAFVTMFLDEARLAAQLDHQNIVQVYDFGRDGESYFIAMEYLHGENVQDILETALDRGKRIPIKHALTIVTSVAAALGYAHRKEDSDGVPLHIVHRDVAPSNILVTYDGAVKLADFGIARADSNNNETDAGLIKGKLSYLSPEQCVGGSIDGRTDIFSLGIVLYELTTMSRLFPIKKGDKLANLERIAACKIPRPSRRVHPYPAELERIVMRALHPAPQRRYQTAGEMIHDLEAFARKQGYTLSGVELGRFVRKLTGNRLEPWRSGPGDCGRRWTEDDSVLHQLGIEALATTDAVPPVLVPRKAGEGKRSGSHAVSRPTRRSDTLELPAIDTWLRRRRAMLWAALGILVMLLAGVTSYQLYEPGSLDVGLEVGAASAGNGGKGAAPGTRRNDPAGAPTDEAAASAPESAAGRSGDRAGKRGSTSRARKSRPPRRSRRSAREARRTSAKASADADEGSTRRSRRRGSDDLSRWDSDDVFPPSVSDKR